MTPEGWQSPEFEPDRRRRSHTMPLPLALVVGTLVALYVAAMVSVATDAYFDPVSRDGDRSPSNVDPEATRTESLAGNQTAPGTTVATSPSVGVDAGPGGVVSTSPTTATGTDGRDLPGPAGTTPTESATAAPVAPPVTDTTDVTRPPAVPPTSGPPTGSDPVPPRASRSESECPLVSGASTALRATTLLVNLLDGPVVVTVNGQRVEVESGGCRTVTVDASDPAGVEAADLVEVVRGDPACSARFEGSLIDVARSYELQIMDGTISCAGVAGLQPDISLFEAQLWRGVAPNSPGN